MLPAPVVAAIDWDTVVLESGSFIDPDLADRHSDLLFSAQLRDDGSGPPVLLYLVLEHQSTNDDDMTLRVLVYVVRIWERYRKTHSGPLPLIIPAVISHAPEGWTAPTCFHEMFDPRPDSIPGLAALVPNFSLLLEDLTRVDDQGLRRWQLPLFARLTLAMLRDARDADRLRRNLPLWVTWLDELMRSPSGPTKVEQALRYVLLVAGELRFEELCATLLEIPETKEVAMTIAEQLRAEGHAKGHAQGHAQGHAHGLADALAKQMTLKFGALSPDHAARIATATELQLDVWIERILTASTPEAVFGPL
jgi:predicted transposase/invertase (TIGR01784 family)